MPELNEILNNAMKLPLHERAYLAEMLSKSIYEKTPDAWTDTVIPVRHKMTAKEVFADIYGILSDDVAEGWYEDCKKQNLASEIRNPWDF